MCKNYVHSIISVTPMLYIRLSQIKHIVRCIQLYEASKVIFISVPTTHKQLHTSCYTLLYHYIHSLEFCKIIQNFAVLIYQLLQICQAIWRLLAFNISTFVTGPAKIGYICQNTHMYVQKMVLILVIVVYGKHVL